MQSGSVGFLVLRRWRKETHQAEEGMFFGDKKTGMKSVREFEEYGVQPNQLTVTNLRMNTQSSTISKQCYNQPNK